MTPLLAFFVGAAVSAGITAVALFLDVYAHKQPEIRGRNALLVYGAWCAFELAIFSGGVLLGYVLWG